MEVPTAPSYVTLFPKPCYLPQYAPDGWPDQPIIQPRSISQRMTELDSVAHRINMLVGSLQVIVHLNAAHLPISSPASVANEVFGRTPMDNNTISAGSLSPDLKITSSPLTVRSKEATAFSR